MAKQENTQDQHREAEHRRNKNESKTAYQTGTDPTHTTVKPSHQRQAYTE